MALDFEISPYFVDKDHEVKNNYMQVLFRPARAVQARELSVLQSILQNQISTLSGYVFAEGSPIQGGHISLDTTVWALQLQNQFNSIDINLNDFLQNGVPTLVANTSGAVKAVVMAVDSTQVNPVLMIKYLTAAQFSNIDTVIVQTGVQTEAYVFNSNTYTSHASIASISEGIFYSGGYFVQVPAQTIVIDSTTNQPSYYIGLSISENIVDEISDTQLLDPAQGSFNYQAPGATRYQYELNFDKRTFGSTDLSAFYTLLTVVNGLITQQVDYPVFADLDKALAQRTYDTSGDFTVKPFVVSVEDNAANTQQFFLNIEPGKAYVKGFEFQTIGVQQIAVPKARTTNTATDYGMSLDYGNYIIAQNLYGGNVSGIFDITQYQSIDLHVTSSGTINTVSGTTYAQTQIGTAKVRDIEFLGLGQYYVYLTAISMSPKSFIASAGGTNWVQIPNASGSSPIANVYANVICTVNTGGTTDTRTITQYFTNGTCILNQTLSVSATGASNVSLNFAIKDIESGVVTPNTFSANVFYNQSTANADYACFDVGVAGKTPTGNAVLNDVGFNKMIFPLPQNYIANATISNASFQTRKNLWSQTFTSGNLTISSGSGLGTGESFPYGYTGILPAIVANNNIMVVVRNALSSGYANGTLLNFGVGNTVTQSTSTTLTIASSAAATFVGDVIITVQVTNASSASVARRSKTVIGNSAQTFIQTGATNAAATRIIGSSPANSVYVDTANGYVWYTSNSAYANTPGANQSLYVADVFNVLAIYDSGNTSYAPSNANAANLINITNNYYLDSGQRDNYYDYAHLVLKPGASPPIGQTVALIQYYQADTIGSPVLGFFDCDSYASNVYAAGTIPYYQSQSFGTISLRDSIDFRPTRTIGTIANVNQFILSGLKTPYPDVAMVLTYGYYLPRTDKLMLSKDKVFRMANGIPSQYPVPPTDADDAMTLYIMTLPAFTGNVYQVQLQYIEHKRYTMQDIGVLDTRIQSLELQSTMTALEQQASNEKILYQDGVTAKDSYGILADDFGDFSICDNQNNDLRCYMAQGSLTPFKDQHTHLFTLQANTNGYFKSGKCYMLPFTESVAVSQNTGSGYISIQPFLFGQFKGTTSLTPETVTKYSANIAPQIIAPPATTAPEQPPAPTPKTSPALSANAPVQQSPVVVGSQGQTSPISTYWDYWYFRNGTKTYYRVPRTVNGYGAISPFYHWYGKPTAATTVTKAATTVPNGGSSIQLAAGTAANIASAAVSNRGSLHLFGLK